LADLIDTILDKGLVIDAYVRVSLLGIELLTIDARVVVASVDTYLRFADAVNRLDISEQEQQKGLPQVLGDVGGGAIKAAAKSKTRSAIEQAGERLRKFVGGDEQPPDDARGTRRTRDR
jgi:hypothetical protein